jgi:hypothetical protein
MGTQWVLAATCYVLANDLDKTVALAPKEGWTRPMLDDRVNALTARGLSGHVVSVGHGWLC